MTAKCRGTADYRSFTLYVLRSSSRISFFHRLFASLAHTHTKNHRNGLKANRAVREEKNARREAAVAAATVAAAAAARAIKKEFEPEVKNLASAVRGARRITERRAANGVTIRHGDFSVCTCTCA